MYCINYNLGIGTIGRDNKWQPCVYKPFDLSTMSYWKVILAVIIGMLIGSIIHVFITFLNKLLLKKCQKTNEKAIFLKLNLN